MWSRNNRLSRRVAARALMMRATSSPSSPNDTTTIPLAIAPIARNRSSSSLWASSQDHETARIVLEERAHFVEAESSACLPGRGEDEAVASGALPNVCGE
jgi:hypothetical protein